MLSRLNNFLSVWANVFEEISCVSRKISKLLFIISCSTVICPWYWVLVDNGFESIKVCVCVLFWSNQTTDVGINAAEARHSLRNGFFRVYVFFPASFRRVDPLSLRKNRSLCNFRLCTLDCCCTWWFFADSYAMLDLFFKAWLLSFVSEFPVIKSRVSQRDRCTRYCTSKRAD